MVTDDDAEPLDAGVFSVWLADMRAAVRGEQDADVACGACTACCTASQFVHIEPDEIDALAHVPAALLFPAPGLPQGHVLLGYDERGHCPMLVDGGCSIYEHRPRTCRTYDCRIFPATGLLPEEPEKKVIAERARRWRFSYPTERDRALGDEVEAAARADGSHASATERAVRAVMVSEPPGARTPPGRHRR